MGELLGQLAYPLFGDLLISSLYKEEYFALSMGMLLLGTVPLIVDGSVQALSDYRSNNPLRLLTGILFGVSVSLCIDVI